MEFIIVKNGKIKEHLCSQGKPQVKLLMGETLQEVGDGFPGSIGEDVRVFDPEKKWTRKPMSRLITEGLMEVPKGHQLKGETLVPKSVMDQYKDGELSRDEVFNALYQGRRLTEIDRIVRELDQYRNEEAMVEAGVLDPEKRKFSEKDYLERLRLLQEWKDFKETCDIENPKYPE